MRTDSQSDADIVDAHKGRRGPNAAVGAAGVRIDRALAQALNDAAPAVFEGQAQAAFRCEQECEALCRQEVSATSDSSDWMAALLGKLQGQCQGAP